MDQVAQAPLEVKTTKANKMAKLVGGAGGGGSSGGSEASDNLKSSALLSIVDLLGEGQIGGLVDNSPSSVFLNDTPLASKSGSYNFEDVTWGIVTGTQDQDALGDGFNAVESVTSLNLKVTNASPAIFTVNDPNAGSVRVIVSTPGLTYTNSKGDISGSSVAYKFEVSVNGGHFYQVGLGQISGKTRSRYQRAYVKELPKTAPNGELAKSWTIRVTRTTPDSSNSRTSNDLYVDSYSTIIDTRLTYPNTAVFGLQVNSEQFTTEPQRSYLLDGLLIRVPSNRDKVSRTYNGVWDGTFKLEVCDNPAWILYDIITNERYGLGQYVPELYANAARLYEIGRYCDEMIDDGFGQGNLEPRFTINTTISSLADAFQLISDITSVFNGMAYWTGNTIGYMADMPTPVSMIYSPSNVIDGEFIYQGSSRKDRHSVVLVRYNDPDRNYEAQTEYIEDSELIERFGVRKAEIAAFGCTTRGQAYRVGKWLLYTEKYQSAVITFKVGIDSALVLPGDVIQIVDPHRSGKRHGGRLVACTAKSATLDDKVTIETGSTISLRTEKGDVVERLISSSKVVIAADGRELTQVLWATALVNLPVKNSVWQISSPSVEPLSARVVSVGQGDNPGEFSISAIEHNPSKFDYIEKDMLLETTKTTTIDPKAVVEPTSKVTLVSEKFIEQDTTRYSLSIAWEQVTGAVSYLVKYRKESGNWIELPAQTGLSVDVENIYAGNYEASVQAVSPLNSKSQVTYSELTSIEGSASVLPKLTSFAGDSLAWAIGLNWTFSSVSSGVKYTEIQQSLNYNPFEPGTETWTSVANVPFPAKEYTIAGLTTLDFRYFRARIVDGFNNYGEWSDVVLAYPTSDIDSIKTIIEGQVGIEALDSALSGKVNTTSADATKALADAKAAADAAIKEVADRKAAIAAETKARTNSIKAQADALAKEVTDRTAAIAAEATGRDAAIATAAAKEATDRANALAAEASARNTAITTAVSKEATDRAAAITAEATARGEAINAETVARTAAITAEATARGEAITAAVSKEATDRGTAIAAEAKARGDALAAEATARTTAIAKEVTDRKAAITKEVTDRNAAITAKAKEINADVAAKVKTLNDGITQEVTDRKAGDTAVVGQLNAYKTSNDKAVAAVLEKAETAISNDAATASKVTGLQSSLDTTNSNVAKKADATALTALETKVTQQGNDLTSKSGQITELAASIDNINLRGQDLVSNGLGQLQSNKYWSGAEFTAADKPSGAGSFIVGSRKTMIVGDELIAVDPTRVYRLSYALRQMSPGVIARAYGMFVPYDVDKLTILPYHYMAQTGTLTKLAKPLKKGDTTMTLEDASKWNNVAPPTSSHLLSAIFWNYTDGKGYTWPANTYSRNYFGNLYTAGSINGNVITLRTPWTDAEIPAGTEVSNGASGGNYLYLGLTGGIIPQEWTTYTGDLAGAHQSGIYAAAVGKLPMMTAYVRVGFLANRQAGGANDPASVMAFGAVSIRDWSVASDESLAKTVALNATNTEVSRINGVVTTHGTSIAKLQSDLSATDTKAGTAVANAATAQQTANTATTAAGANASRITELDSSFKSYQTANDKAIAQTNANVSTVEKTSADADKALGIRIDTVVATAKTDKTDVTALVTAETSARTSADTALSGRIDALTASTNTELGKTNAAVTAEQTARTSADTALGKRIDTVTANAATDKSTLQTAITTEQTARTTADTALGKRIDAVTATAKTDKADVTALITAETTARTTADAAMTSRVDTLTTTVTNNNAAVTGSIAEVAESVTDLEGSTNTKFSSLESQLSNTNKEVGVVKAAAANAQSTANTAVSDTAAVAGRTSTLEGKMTAAEGNIAKKADATALNDYYTKAQSDASATTIAAGEVNKYSAKLTIGGSNLYFGPNPVVLRSQTSEGRIVFPAVASGNTQRFNYLTDDNLDLSGLQIGDPTISSIEIFVPSTDTSDYTIQFGTYRFSGNGYIYAPTVDVKTLPKDTWVKLTTAPGTYVTGQPPAGINLVFNMVGRKTAGDEIRWRNFMMEKATTASSFVEADRATQAKLDANSTAINTTNAEVARVDGVVTAQGSSINKLQSDLTALDDKANAITEATALAQQTANTAVTSSSANASAISELDAKFTTKDSDVRGLVTSEQTARSSADAALGKRIDTVVATAKTDKANLTSLVSTETTARTNADSALGQRIDTLSASTTTELGKTNAAVKAEETARTTADTALGQRIDTLTASTNTELGKTNAAVTAEQTARTTADTALGKRIDAVVATAKTDKTDLQSAITSEQTARTSADTALGKRIDTVIATAKTDKSDVTALVTAETTARTTADSALGSRIDTLNTTVANNDTKVTGSIADVAKSVTTLEGSTNTKFSSLESQLSDTNKEVGVVKTAATKAQTTADTAVSNAAAVAGRTSTLEGKMTAVEGNVAKKLDATAINNYYTKAQSDASATTIAAGEVSKYDAKLQIGGVNLATESNNIAQANNGPSHTMSYVKGNPNKFVNVSNNGGISTYTTKFYPAVIGKTYTVSVKVRPDVDTELSLYATSNANGTLVTKSDNFCPANAWTTLWYTFVAKAESVRLAGFQISKGFTDNVTVEYKEYQAEEGTKVTTWSPANEDIQGALDANSSAINSTNAEVTRVDGVVKAQGSSIEKLQSDLNTTDAKAGTAISNAATAQSTANTGVTKADAAASTVNTLKTQYEAKVAQLDAADSANTAAITKTNTDLTNVQTALSNADKALGSRIDSLTTTVSNNDTAVKGQIKTVSDSVTTLTGTVNTKTDKLTADLATANTGITAAKKAAAAAQTTANSAVTANSATASRVGALESKMTTVEGGLAKKAEASALNNYYTKSQTEGKAAEIAAGEVAKYDAGLVLGGQNLIPDSKNFRVGSAASANELVRTILADGSLQVTNKGALSSSYLATFQSAKTTFTDLVDTMRPGEQFTVTVWFKAVDTANLPTANPTLYLASNGLGYYALNGDRAALAKGKEVPFSHTRAWPEGAVVISPHFTFTAASLGGGLIVTKWQIERGTKSSDWSPSPTEVQSSLNANASAINSTNAEVTRIDGQVKSQASSLSKLQSDLNTADAKAGTAVANAATAQSTANTGVTKADAVAARTSTLESKMATVEGNVAKKANATALNSYYTKTEADSATAGKIDEFKSSLSIGGVNQLLNSEAERVASPREYLMYENSAHIYQFYEDNLGKDVTISFDLKVAVAGAVQVYCSNGTHHTFSAGVSVKAADVNKWVRYSVTVQPRKHSTAANATYTTSAVEFYGTYNTGRFPAVRKVQLEAGSFATDWSVSPRDLQNAINVNATAISDTYTKAETNKAITTATSSLKSQVDKNLAEQNSTITTWVERNKVEAAMMETLAAELVPHMAGNDDLFADIEINVGYQGVITALADTDAATMMRVDTLEANFDNANAQIQATQRAMADLEHSTAQDLLELQANFKTTVNDTLTPAVADLNAKLKNEYLTIADSKTAISSATTTLKSEVTKGYTDAIKVVDNAINNIKLDSITIPDTRSANQLPTWYRTNYKSRMVNEFKTATVIGLTTALAGQTYVMLTTYVYYSDSSGGPIKQVATGKTDDQTYIRYSTGSGSSEVWGAWVKQGAAMQTTITEQSQTIDGIKGIKTVTIDNNGVMSGYGLVSELVGGQVTSAFGVNADQFYVGSPKTGKKVFAVVNGQTVINDAVIGNLSASKITTGTMHGDRITAGTLTADKLSAVAIDAIALKAQNIVVYKDKTKPKGVRLELVGGLLSVYDDANTLRVRLGFWS